MKMGG